MLQIRDMSPGCTGRLAATPPDAGNSQDGVLRWMETYANALASGMYKACGPSLCMSPMSMMYKVNTSCGACQCGSLLCIV